MVTIIIAEINLKSSWIAFISILYVNLYIGLNSVCKRSSCRFFLGTKFIRMSCDSNFDDIAVLWKLFDS